MDSKETLWFVLACFFSLTQCTTSCAQNIALNDIQQELSRMRVQYEHAEKDQKNGSVELIKQVLELREKVRK